MRTNVLVRGGLVAVASLAALGLLATPAYAFGHQVFFTDRQISAAETAGAIIVTVSRDGAQGVGSVDYMTVNGSAVSGQDYVAAAGTLAYFQGEQVKSFTITLLDDEAVEGDEIFTIVLRHGTGVITDLGDAATVTLRSDDAPPTSVQPPTAPPPTTGADEPVADDRPTSLPSTAATTDTTASSIDTTAVPPPLDQATSTTAQGDAAKAAAPGGDDNTGGRGGGRPVAVLVAAGAVVAVATVVAARRYRSARTRHPDGGQRE